ncbi:MAG TPA: tetratricopeptide repeat protein [Ktedonobacterales bacterium]
MPTSAGNAEEDVLRVYLLGGFRARVGFHETPPDAWKLRRARSLVKLLALAPRRRMHRERIIDLLWPDQDLENPDNSLHQAIYAARHALGGSGLTAARFLQTRDGVVTLTADDSSAWVDVEAFEVAAASARQCRQPEAYRAALDLYQGPLLPEDAYEGWVSGRAEMLRQLYVDLLVELAGAYERDGLYGEATVELLRAVNTDVAREDAHVGLMRLHALTGQRGDALRRFETLRRVLRDELNAEPQDASARLYEAILSNQLPSPGVLSSPHTPTSVSASAAPVRNALPALNRFIGRTRELDEIARLLAGARVVTIVGPGGSGKTRLALEVAAMQAPRYPAGAWLVELASVENSLALPQALAAALEVIEQPNQPLVATITAALATRGPMLVALDNCEHLITACAELVEALLHACPGVTLLCTSREPLHIPGETVWRLSSLGLPQTGSASGLETALGCDSVQLFLDRARALAPALTLDARATEAIARICTHLDGLPLAIELAAARVGTVALDEIADRLESGLGALGRGSRTAPTRQQTLVATLDWSYASLTERERRLFRRLAVFPAPFDLEAAEWVSAEDDAFPVDDADALDALGTLDTLAALVDKSLVTIDESAGAARYRLLEPLRQYAERRLKDCGERQVALRKRYDWGLALTERANGLLWGPSHTTAVARLEAAYPALRATLEWRLRGEGDAPAAARLIVALWQFWVLRGMYSEGRYWVETLLASVNAPDGVRAEALLISFGLMLRPGDFAGAAARETIERSVALYQALGESEGSRQALRMLGIQAFMAGDLERAGTAAAESLARARATGDLAGEGLSLHSLGVLAWARGAYPEAIAHMEAALTLFRAVQGRPLVTIALVNMGLTPFDASPNSLLVNEETWTMLGALSGAALVGHTLAHLGAQARAMGDLESARARLEESVTWFRQCGHQAGLAQALGQLGAVLRVRGDFAGAHALLEESLTLRSQLGDRRGVGMTLNNIALLAVAEEDFSRAEALLAQVMASFVETGDLSGIEMTRDIQAFSALRQGDHLRALSLYQECLASAVFASYQAPIHSPLDFTAALTGLASAAAAGGFPEIARERLNEAAALYERIGDLRRAISLRSRSIIAPAP